MISKHGQEHTFHPSLGIMHGRPNLVLGRTLKGPWRCTAVFGAPWANMEGIMSYEHLHAGMTAS